MGSAKPHVGRCKGDKSCRSNMNQQINFRLIYTPAVMFWKGCILNYMKMRSVTKALSSDFTSYSAESAFRFQSYLHWISCLRIIYIHQVCKLSVYILYNWKTRVDSRLRFLSSLLLLSFVINVWFGFWNKVNRARRITCLIITLSDYALCAM